MTKRIPVPANAVRTREQILDGLLVRDGCVWLTCHNCSGTGNYRSSCIPSGRCRFYCWGIQTNDIGLHGMPAYRSKIGTEWENTYGKLPYPTEKYVKREQASDRADYRAKVRYELERPEREAAQRQADIARAERELESRYWREAMDAAIAARVCLGSVGEKITVTVGVEGVHGFESRFGHGSIVRMRDAESNQLVWFTSGLTSEFREAAKSGERIAIVATVKDHDQYNGEAQTKVTRVKLAS